jgi:hypothetical protein
MPIAVHASPNKWSGQPTRAAAGTGEGGAAYGEGLYATVPSNARGIDKRYRQDAIDATHPDILNMDPQIVFDEMVRRIKEKGDIESYDMLRGVEIDADPMTAAQDISDIASNAGVDMSDMLAPAPTGSFHVWDVPDRLMDWDAKMADQPASAAKIRPLLTDSAAAELPGQSGNDLYLSLMNESGQPSGMPYASDTLKSAGIQGHTYAGEAGSARTSGIEGNVPNFVIYDDAAVKPLGTFGSAEEWLASDLYRQLKPRIDAEEALRAAGQATPEAYAEIRRRFAEAIGNAGR